MKKQLRASFKEAPIETQYGVHYNKNQMTSTQRSLDKLSKYIPEIHTLVKTIDEFEQNELSKYGQSEHEVQRYKIME